MKILIVDDSALVRTVVREIMSRDPEVTHVDAAVDPIFAERRIRENPPDVIILDMEMPRMDGLTFLRKLMREDPRPVVVFSTLTAEGSELGLELLKAGAVGIIEKPKMGMKAYAAESGANLLSMVKTAAASHLRKIPLSVPMDGPATSAPQRYLATREALVAIGASAGGTVAIETVLREMTPGCPGILIVQHMPEAFTGQFANRLNQVCDIEVREAKDGDVLKPGVALIAPGNHHMLLARRYSDSCVELSDAPPVKRHRPSVDVLFRSVALLAGKSAMGVILSGMGDDGADGLLEMKQAGALTIAQSEETCLVFGMPGSAVDRGAVTKQVPLPGIAAEIHAYGRAHG